MPKKIQEAGLYNMGPQKQMPPKGMPQKGMHQMPDGTMMKNSEMQTMMKGKKKKSLKK